MTLLTEGGHTPAKVVTCFTEAVHTVDPWQAVGKLSALWIAFARYYEGHGDLTNARAVFSRASEADFRSADDLAAVWCEWAELEMRVGAYAEALSLMQRATTEPAGRKARAGGAAKSGLC
jgi:pre-mRNA-splicing factor SYF1